MKYHIICLDNRFSYRDRFEYAIKFSNTMSHSHGPLAFNDALKWFYETYGWSAEIRAYEKISKWVDTSVMITKQYSASPTVGMLSELPEHCNPHWSWTNGFDDSLRIYVKSDAELAFFQLKFPVDQK